MDYPTKAINMKKIKLTKEQVQMLKTKVNESTDVSGGINRVNNTFKREFKKSDVENLSEEPFDITKPIQGVPSSKMKNKKELKLSEDTQSAVEMIKHFADLVYNNPSQSGLSTFFQKNGITWGDIATYLTSVGILGVTTGGIHRIVNIFRKAYKSKEEKLIDLPNIANKAIVSIQQNPEKLITIHKEREGGKPNSLDTKVAAQQKPESNWKKEPTGFNPNRFEPSTKTNGPDMPYMDTNESNYPDGVENNPNFSPNEGDCQTEYPSKSDAFKGEYMNREIALLNGNDGSYMFDYADTPRENLPNPKCELDVEDIAIYVSRNYNDKTIIRVGNSLKDYLEGHADLLRLTEDVKQWLRDTYAKDKKFVSVIDKLMETTTAGSSGAFTGLFSGNPNKKDNTNSDYTPANQLEMVNDEEVVEDDVIEEMTAAGSSTGDPSSSTTGQYVQPRIWAKNKENWAGNKKTQYPDGEMVKFDPCTKLNNNKKAQNGGCSQGASDSVVKTYKTKNSVISKNTSIYEQVATKTGRTVEEVKNLIQNRINKNLPKN